MNEIKRSGFYTSQTKVIQALIEIYCNLLIGKTIRDLQDVIKNYDTKFESIDSSRRIHSLIYKDEGGNKVEPDERMNNRIVDNYDDNSEDNQNKENDNIVIEDDTINIPPQAIPPSEE